MSKPRRSAIFKDAFGYIATLTGENFFRELISTFVNVFQVDAAWIAEYHKEQHSLTTVAYSIQEQLGTNISYLVDGTPCERVIRSNALVHLPQNVSALFPRAHKVLKKLEAQSFSGFPLQDDQGGVIGTMALLHGSAATWEEEEVAYVFQLIKVRVQSELLRLKREREIINRENQLRGLINGVQDLLINLNEKGFIVMLNATAEASLNAQEDTFNKYHISQFLTDQSKSKLLSLIENFQDAKTEGKYVWIPGTLEIIPSAGQKFSVEGTLSQYDLDDKIYYTLVLRVPDERTDSGEQVKYLINQTEYVREELEDIKQSDQMLGESNAFKRLLQNIYMVAHTDATVLINGETGTGKELVARHIHTTSNRKNKPMISINCGAIPATLIESEFFGHAKGAFTGATAERKGRFQMADGGTIFLDEIGELPLDLQVKLLRVIQEGEFEPVGSSKTVKVDVRIIAATHRNLFELSKENKFREDLYYRLNVFPIEVPSLRERSEDIPLLAASFINKFSKRINKKINPLTEENKTLLKAYSWPGNIRELQNIIERSVILAQQGKLDLQTTLGFMKVSEQINRIDLSEERILTKDELIEFEKRNIIRALKATNWKVSGKDGAAALLKMVPSTLSSRIAALQIQIPN